MAISDPVFLPLVFGSRRLCHQGLWISSEKDTVKVHSIDIDDLTLIEAETNFTSVLEFDLCQGVEGFL